MATKIVKKTGSDSGTSGPFKTISYGVKQLNSGDVLVVEDGTYNEKVTINASDVSVVAANYYNVIIKGTWLDTSTFPAYYTAANFGQRFRAQVLIQGNNVEFAGFHVTNCLGRGITTTGDGWNVHDCLVTDTFNTAIQSYQNDDGIFERCSVNQTGLQRWWQHKSPNGFEVKKHPNIFPLVQSRRSIIRNCSAIDNGGEGIDVFRCGGDIIIENNIAGNNSALQFYVNVTGDGLIHRNNIAFLSKPLKELIGTPKNAGGFEWRDEAESYDVGYARSENVKFYNNLSVNCSEGLWIAKSAGLKNAVIANNTFIQGPYSLHVLRVEKRESGTEWTNSKIINNIFYGDDLRINLDNVNEIIWSNNAWKVAPPNAISSPFDVTVTHLDFENLVELPNGAPNAEYYRLRATSNCINKGQAI